MTLTSTIFLRTLSSLHAGTGDDNGLVDLPIQRELVTGYPKIEASTLKGAIRRRVEDLNADNTKIHLAFGYDDQSSYHQNNVTFAGDGDESRYARYFAGALTFTDARILLFPVRSMWGVFAQITCPYVLRRFVEDLELKTEDFAVDNLEDNKVMSSAAMLNNNGCIILEEYVFSIKPVADNIVEILKSKGLDTSRLVVVSDNVFGDFTQLFTERMTRNKIHDRTGVVQDGGLFTEEYLPPEAVLYSLMMADAPRQPKGAGKYKELPNDFKTAKNVQAFIAEDCWGGADKKKVVQIGGNTTVGKGMTELTFKISQP